LLFNKDLEGGNMFKRRKIILGSFILFILMASITYLMWEVADVTKDKENYKGQSSKKTDEMKEGQESSLAELIKKKEEEFKKKLNRTEYQLKGNWELKPTLVLKTYYKKCGDTVIEKKDLDSKLAGLRSDNLINGDTGWKVVKRSARQVVLEKELNEACPEHKDEMYLGIKDGVVAIFYGNPQDEEKVLKRKTNISAEVLPDKEIQNLEVGIEVKSQRQLLILLEGLASIQDEKIE